MYPPTLDQLVSGKYISSIPVGMSGHEYFYSGTIFTVNGNGNGNVCASYHLGVLLENNSNSLDKAAHDEAGIACAGGNQSVLKDARDISNTPKNLWYDVVSPDTFKSQ